MDLWIRSQDRRALYKTSGFFIREEQYKKKGKYIIEGNECWLGAYNTFERALEVLDEIQRLISLDLLNENISYQEADIYLKTAMLDSMARIYEMPEE